jgi:hypothetical protein
MSLVSSVLTGVIGAATEQWGCSTGLWNWVSSSYPHGDRDTTSLWMVGGSPQGFPIEVVVAYGKQVSPKFLPAVTFRHFFAAGAGFWMASISKVVLAPEHDDVARAAGTGGSHDSIREGSIAAALRRITTTLLVGLACSEPAYVQSACLLCAGINVASGLTTRATWAAVCWGVLVGVCGLFFEMFATGGLLENVAVWRYDQAKHHEMVQAGALQAPMFFLRTAPYTALFAYIGTGLVVFGSTFHVTRLGLARPEKAD